MMIMRTEGTNQWKRKARNVSPHEALLVAKECSFVD